MLLEINEDAWDLFLACQTQWRVSMAGPVGLDYAALYRVAETLEIEVTPQLLRKVRVLEAKAMQKREGT